MKIKSYYQWEVYEIAKQLVLCQIHIMPRKMLYYHGQQNSYKTHRWMTNEDWVAVENAIENALSKRSSEGRIFENLENSKEKILKINHSLTLTLRELKNVELANCVAKETEDKYKLVVQCTIEHRDYTAGKDKTKDRNSEICVTKNEETENSQPEDAKRISKRIIDKKYKDEIEENKSETIEETPKKSQRTKNKPVLKSDTEMSKSKSKLALVTPESKKLDKSLSASKGSSKKRRLHDCSQEKSTLNKWLKVKENKQDSKDVKEKKSRTYSPLKMKKKTAEFLKSADDFEKNILIEKKQLQTNQEMADYLRGMMKSVPENYKFLSLMDLDKKTISKSLDHFKKELDELFETHETSETIKGANGIDHYLVINLINNDIQLEMMRALSEVYECENASLIANVLLPEWLICLFMQHHKLSRSAAMDQLKLQEEYQIHSKGKYTEADLDESPVKKSRRCK